MPVLRGGAKHRHRKRPYGTDVRGIKRKGWVGGGHEGNVFEVEVVVKGKGRRTRKVVMVEKGFYAKSDLSRFLGKPLRDPVFQFNTMNKLIALNREKELGLEIAITVRPREKRSRRSRKPNLVITRLKTRKVSDLTKTQGTEFERDRGRQQKILDKFEWHANDDAFFPRIDKHNGKCIAVIGDFRNVYREFRQTIRNIVPYWRNPTAQFGMMNELAKLNREKGLGLRITPTIRLHNGSGKKPTLVMTRLKLSEVGELSDEGVKEFARDMRRQQRVLRENGYFVGAGSFSPHVDAATKKCVAVIVDFGTVYKL